MFILKRLLIAIPTLWAMITIAFIMVYTAPGGPFDAERKLPAAILENLEAKYNLDDSLLSQYGQYLWNLVQGDFGPSFKYTDLSVNEIIAAALPVSFTVGGLSLLVAVLIGTAIGTFAALRQNKFADYGSMGAAMVGISIPVFVTAPLLVLWLAVAWQWLPVAGWEGGEWQRLVLPVTALALPQVAYVARLMRGSMIEILRSPFVRTARAKGLSTWKVLTRHALKPALIPIVSYLGPAAAGVITGTVVIEKIFGLPGMGNFFINAAFNRDYTLIMAVVVIYGVTIILFNLLADIMYGVLDPRSRHSLASSAGVTAAKTADAGGEA